MAPSRLMTTTEVGKELGITRQQVRWRIIHGHLTGTRIGQHWFVREAEVRRRTRKKGHPGGPTPLVRTRATQDLS